MGFNDGSGAVESWNRAGVIMQIESEEGAKHADEIAAVDGGKCTSMFLSMTTGSSY